MPLMDDAVRFGRAFKRRLDESGMSLRELASKVGVSAAYLSSISTGKTMPSMARANKIAKALGVDFGQFILESIGPVYFHGRWDALIKEFPYEASVLMSRLSPADFLNDKFLLLLSMSNKVVELADGLLGESPESAPGVDLADRLWEFFAVAYAYHMLVGNVRQAVDAIGSNRASSVMSSKDWIVGMFLVELEPLLPKSKGRDGDAPLVLTDRMRYVVSEIRSVARNEHEVTARKADDGKRNTPGEWPSVS